MEAANVCVGFSFCLFFCCIAFNLDPGLYTALILRTASIEGGRKAFHAALGINTGCLIWGAMVAFGLGALLAVSELAYTFLKWCGACYLAWLGVQMLLRPRIAFSQFQKEVSSNWYLRGMLGNVLNPKVGIFYVSFLPQFIPDGHSPVLWTFLLVAIHVLIGTVWSLILIMTTQYASSLLRRQSFVMWMDRLTGGLFLMFAVKLATSSK